MKTKLFLFWLFGFVFAPLLCCAQTVTPSNLQADINQLLWSNGANLITGAEVKFLLNTTVQVFNTWSAPLASPLFTGTVTIPSGSILNRPTSIDLTNAINLPLSTGVIGVLSVTNGGTGYSNLTANLPLFGNGTSGIISGTRSGTTTEVATVGAAPTPTNCAQWDSNGNLTSSSLPCGSSSGGSGTVSSAPQYSIGYWCGSGTTTTICGLAPLANSVLVMNGSNVPSMATTFPSGLTAPSLTVTGAFTATGLVTNADLVNSSVTVNGTTCTLGSSCVVSTISLSVFAPLAAKYGVF